MRETSITTPNVLTEVALKQRLETGSTLMIKCCQSPTRKASVWYGLWTMEAHHPDGSSQMLVTARSRLVGQISVREFKTVTGIVSFLKDCGFTKVTFPMIEGDFVSLPMDS
ncbi:hypothetical protein BCF46_3817 [Litoreibacter meonggei]|uniref:Uncharacterized protein n=1 Tax=Litoreibacter meonggei TaxID=1049199 RepID=A0A497V6T7_9RHOB|nr:hypothetical protein [Litoreibacter meonggei]RLJ36235.1 hypothetical protein BCF46_3817 [Litoreibacter meonggei]|tara:strand:+ start:565 stop:897 length:333 start_codon:yes stop_codon:yes gene_type:complete